MQQSDTTLRPPLEPEKPLPTDCCDTGCDVCVFDRYAEDMAQYRRALENWQEMKVRDMTDSAEQDELEISKSQAKRDDAQMQDLGARLVKLPKRQMSELPVNDSLLSALQEFSRIPSREAQRRHIKRIGRLLREHDVDQVSLALDRLDPSSSLSMQATRKAQRWCDRLIQDGKSAVTAFIDEFPDIEIQTLNQLLRRAQKELAQQEKSGQSPGITPAQRELLRLIRQVIVRQL